MLGIDAWWMDATEPDLHSNLDHRFHQARIGPTAMGPARLLQLLSAGALRRCLRGFTPGQPDKRVFILTRSGFAGTAAPCRRGVERDIASRWDDLYNQISAGVSIGYPACQLDLRHRRLRQRGPLQRANRPRPTSRSGASSTCAGSSSAHSRRCSVRTASIPLSEIFNLAPQGSEVYDSLVWHDKLSYRLLPYIYTVAADTFHHDGTIMRGLAMDFADDAAARDVRDEYLFGKAFLVAPVYKLQGAHAHRSIYRRGADWYDFHSGTKSSRRADVRRGGAAGAHAAVRARGSIVPVGPDIQYTADKPGGRSRCSCSRVPTAASTTTKTTA